jgi:hypothetical protein
MASIYTIELYAVSGLQGQGPTRTPPSGRVWVVRDISCYSAIGGVDTSSQLFAQDALTGGAWAFFSLSLPSDDKKSFQWSGRQAFTAIGGFTFNAAVGAWDIRVTGYDLSA